MNEVHSRIVDLYVSMSYRWADAKQIRDDILREPERRPCNNSEYPSVRNKLAIIENDLLDTLDLIRESRRLLSARHAREDARAIDILANKGSPYASF